MVFASLIKTNHRAVFVKQTLLSQSKLKILCERKKIKVYVRRSYHLDVLRHSIGRLFMIGLQP